jgi:hypothetical protein
MGDGTDNKRLKECGCLETKGFPDLVGRVEYSKISEDRLDSWWCYVPSSENRYYLLEKTTAQTMIGT